jgi:hypothetical protein
MIGVKAGGCRCPAILQPRMEMSAVPVQPVTWRGDVSSGNLGPWKGERKRSYVPASRNCEQAIQKGNCLFSETPYTGKTIAHSIAKERRVALG